MCRVESNPCVWRPPAWADAVAAAGRCPGGGVNEHRLAERPVVNALLEYGAGEVPYSTHLEIVAARARKSHRAVEAALERMKGTRPDYGRLAAKSPRQLPAPVEPVRARPVERTQPEVQYSIARRRWPIGGLIDLIV